MVLNRKASFFLDLGSEGTTTAQVPIAAAKPAPAAKPEAAAKPAAAALPTTAANPTAAATPADAAPQAASLTTAEAIAAELRAAQEALPPPSLSTFAPDNLNPANALRRRRRLAGANLAGYKAMVAGMFKG